MILHKTTEDHIILSTFVIVTLSENQFTLHINVYNDN